MINAIIIDDELHAIEGLKYELKQTCPQVNIIAESRDPREGASFIKELSPDLLFLDIEMPSMNGFEFLKGLDCKIDFDVIFVTAYDQYAIKAFKFSAVDYLLKPVNSEDLKNAIALLEERKYSFSNDHFSTLMHNLTRKNRSLEKVVLPTAQGLEFVELKNIIRCESDSNYCKVYLSGDKSIYLAKTIKELESLLFDHGFFRIHNSHLVSMQHIVRYVNTDGGFIQMSDATEVPISRSRKREFLKQFK